MAATLKQIKNAVEDVMMSHVADRIDEANHVVKRVKVVGLESKNRRRYKLEAIRAAAPMYEEADVFLDHVANPAKPRGDKVGDRFGVLRNFVVESDGGYADLHYNPHHPRAAQTIYEVKSIPNKIGLSHHADISTSGSNPEVVESIDRVYSVDLVTRPATTKGVFESEGIPMKKTLKELIAAATPKSLSVLEDMMAGGAMMPDMPVEAADGSSADGQIKAAFRSAVIAAFDDESLDSKATLAKIKDVLNAYDKLTGSAKKADKPADGAPAATESVDLATLQSQLVTMQRRDEVRDLAAKEGVTLSDVNLKAAVALESVDDRTAFVKGLPKAVAGKTAPAKPTTTKAATESQVTEGVAAPAKPFEKPGDVLAFIRSGR